MTAGMTTARVSPRGWRRFHGPGAVFLLARRLRRPGWLGGVCGGGGGRAGTWACRGPGVPVGVGDLPGRVDGEAALPVLAGTLPVAGDDGNCWRHLVRRSR